VPEVPGDEERLTPGEAAEALGLSPNYLHYLEARGKLRSTRTLGGHRRYLAASVEALRSERAGGSS